MEIDETKCKADFSFFSQVIAQPQLSKLAILLKWIEKNPDRSTFLVWSENPDGSVQLSCKCEQFRANLRVNGKNFVNMGDFYEHQKECRLLMSYAAGQQVSCQS